MIREYWLSIKKDKKYLDDLCVTIDITDPETLDYTIESIWFEYYDITNKIPSLLDVLNLKICDAISNDYDIEENYYQEIDDLNDDLLFREQYEI